MYDVSSGVGIEKRVPFRMAIGIAQQREFHSIGPTQWIEHARTTEQDRESVLTIVSETLTNLREWHSPKHATERAQKTKIAISTFCRSGERRQCWSTSKNAVWCGKTRSGKCARKAHADSRRTLQDLKRRHSAQGKQQEMANRPERTCVSTLRVRTNTEGADADGPTQ